MSRAKKEFNLVDYNSENQALGTYWERLAEAEARLMEKYKEKNQANRVELTTFKRQSIGKSNNN